MCIVIHGGGILGVILALMLSKLTQDNLEIYLVEKYIPEFNHCMNEKKLSRVIALSFGSYLELLKIDSSMYSILSNCGTSIKHIEISEYGWDKKIFIDAKDYQLLELGYAVKLNSLRKQLFDLLRKKSSVTICCPATLEYVQYTCNNSILILNNGKKIKARLMVAADGSNSVLATYCGIELLKWNYKQIAIVSNIFIEASYINYAFERFTIFGSLAILPISNNLGFLIWCVPKKKYKEVILWDSDKFSKELQNLFEWKLGKMLQIGIRNSYELWLMRATKHIGHRLALVGNAAQNLHPIAGQGFNLGLRDVIVLSKVVSQALFENKDIGDYSILNIYQKRRCLDQNKIIYFTDGLVRLFNNHDLIYLIVRKLGFLCINYSTYLKRLLVEEVFNWKLD